MTDQQIEHALIEKLSDLKYSHRPDIRDRAALEQNFRQHFNDYSKTLLCFLQLFIVSNRSETWYFANNNSRHFSFNADERFLPLYQFADVDNAKITHLDIFADTFLAKCALAEMISRYMVLVASEQKLMMMRPYQIYAVKAIVDCIHQHCGNGYIWHTTGSGKTLTSFKAATLLKDNPGIDKCLFVVDRKDLDRQTREEFNKFQEGCVEENTNTETLVRRLLSDDYADKVIVTTSQKLGLALDGTNKRNYKERLEPLRRSRMVFIFDECHRSQFGDNHQAIKEFFPNAQLFGFTGTPIFEQNASSQQIEGQQASCKTTADIFQQQLHAYTITHAIEDKNGLRFHVDYCKPENHPPPAADPSSPRPNSPPEEGWTAKPDGVVPTKRAIVEAILAKHDTATNQRRFNAVLATASINDAIEYHALFKAVQQIQEDLPQERADNEQEPDKKKAALVAIIADYNARYGTNHTIEHRQAIEQIIPKDRLQSFKGVYLDTAQRLKAHQDTGGDSTSPVVQQLDFEFVLFASALIDYDYIMALIARYASQTPGKQKMSREELIDLIQSDAKFIDDRDALTEYIYSIDTTQPHTVLGVREEYVQYKVAKTTQAIADVAVRGERFQDSRRMSNNRWA